MKSGFSQLTIFFCISITGCANFDVGPQRDVREHILDARQIVAEHGDSVWPGLSAAPFGILLVEEQAERLFCHDNAAEGFAMTGNDPIVSCTVGNRAASFPADIQQTFSAVDDVPVIVIGTPAATRSTVDEWVLTIFHEHFHQMQFSWDGYYPGIAGLGLDDGDTSGDWMLEYAFPYDQRRVANAVRNMAEDLIKALDARDTDEFPMRVGRYRATRERARNIVSDADWRYIELQLWQEGGARWTEGALAALSRNFADAAVDAEDRVIRELTVLNLREHQRAALYSLGAGEVMLLEAGEVDWRTSYWSEPFSLGSQLQKLNADP